MFENEVERVLVSAKDPLITALAPAIEAPVAALRFRNEKLRAHHRRGGQRNSEGDHDRGAEGHCKFAKQPADDSSHQQNGKENGDQRRAHREHGEADLARAAQRRVERTHPILEMTGDVLDHHDRVVDDEASGDREGHQREVVERVAEQVHDSERADERQRHGDARNHRRPSAAKKKKNDEDHQTDGDGQGALDLEHRRANGRRAIEDDAQMNRRWNCRL